jgi:hypothetical protein
MLERRPFVTRSTVVSGVITFLLFAWKVIDMWSNVDFLTEKSGLHWDIAKFLFFSSRGTNILLILSFAVFLLLLLFQRKSTEVPASTLVSAPMTVEAKPGLPIIEFVRGRVIDVWLEEESAELRGPMYQDDEPFKALVAEFRRQPDDAQLGFIDIRASLRFLSDKGENQIVNDACWNVRDGSQFATFEIGDTVQLIVALFHNDKGATYESRTDANPIVKSEDLTDDSYDVDVELIGMKSDKVYIHETFGLKLHFRPEPRLGKRGMGVDTIRVVASRKPAKSFNSISDLKMKAADAPVASAHTSTEDKSQST